MENNIGAADKYSGNFPEWIWNLGISEVGYWIMWKMRSAHLYAELATAGNFRHGSLLTPEKKKQEVKRHLKETPELSNRQIAVKVGVDKNTVTKQRTELESTGEIHQLETNIGADGKERPCPAAPTTKVCSICKQEKPVNE